MSTAIVSSVFESVADKITNKSEEMGLKEEKSETIETHESLRVSEVVVVPQTNNTCCTCQCGGTRVGENPKPVVEETVSSVKESTASSDSGAPELTDKVCTSFSDVDDSVVEFKSDDEIPIYGKHLPRPVAGKLYHSQLYRRGEALLERLNLTAPAICKTGRAPPPAPAPASNADDVSFPSPSTPKNDAAAWLTAGALEKSPNSGAPLKKGTPEDATKEEPKVMKASANKIC